MTLLYEECHSVFINTSLHLVHCKPPLAYYQMQRRTSKPPNDTCFKFSTAWKWWSWGIFLFLGIIQSRKPWLPTKIKTRKINSKIMLYEIKRSVQVIIRITLLTMYNTNINFNYIVTLLYINRTYFQYNSKLREGNHIDSAI